MNFIPLPTDKYVVSFNCMVSGIGVGDPYLRTIDLFGSNMKMLAQEVSKDPRGYSVEPSWDEGTPIKARIFKDGKIKGIMTTIERMLGYEY